MNAVLRNVPNILSCCRMIMSVSLLFIPTMSPAFIAVYLAAFVSDIADGCIARRFDLCTELGSKLDSFADALFTVVFLIVFIPYFGINAAEWIMIAAVAVVEILVLYTVFAKKMDMNSFHTIPNKLDGLVIILAPFFHMAFGRIAVTVCIAAMLALSCASLVIVIRKARNAGTA